MSYIRNEFLAPQATESAPALGDSGSLVASNRPFQAPRDKRRILVVEDEPIIQLDLVALLQASATL